MVGRLVVVPRDGGGIDSPALKKAVEHAHDLLMKEVKVVEMLRKRLGVCVLLCCNPEGPAGLALICRRT